MKIQVLRLNSSSYQDHEFIQLEKSTLEKLKDIEYVQSVSDLDSGFKYILITNTHTEVDKIADNILKNTVLIVHPNSGHDNITQDFVTDAKFSILRGNKIRANAVSEYVLSCIFKHFTEIKNHLIWDRYRKWDRKLISDLKILILGDGHIGSKVASCLAPLVKKLEIVDPNLKVESINPKKSISCAQSCFEKVDVLIIAADLNSSSRHLIDSEKLDQMSDDVVVINAARGEIVKQQDLERHLRLNPRSFAYLDVFSNEPFDSSDFKNLRNVNKTSHIAGIFENLNLKIIEFEKEVIEDFLADTEFFEKKYAKDILK